MSQILNSFTGIAFLDLNGDPYSGAQLFVYDAGTSDKVAAGTITKDSAGASNHANPIILNNDGVISDGSTAHALRQTSGSSIKLVLAPSTDTDPPVSPIRTYDNLQGINDTTFLSQWVSGPTPTYVDATNFTVTGDQTTDFHVGRRLQLTVTAGTVYGTITEVAYTTLTTVTVDLDSGSLDSGLSEVLWSVLSVTNHAIPNTSIPYRTGPDMLENVSISATVATKALTIALKQKDGTDPTSGTPSRVSFRSETLTDGDFDIVDITSALSVVVPDGATLGYAGAAVATVYVYLINNAGAAELAVRSVTKVDGGELFTTTAIGTGSDLSSTFYSTTLRTDVPVRFLGKVILTVGAVAGEWDNSPTQINVGEIHNEADTSGLPTNDIAGLELSVGTDTAHDIDISTGNVVDTTTTYRLTVGSTLTKQIDATFSAGSDAGGMATTVTETGTFTSVGTAVTGVTSAFDTDFVVGDVLYSSSNAEARRIEVIGSATSITLESGFTVDVSVAENVQKNGLAPLTGYYLNLIRKDSDESIDAYFDTDSSAGNIESGYTNYAPLGYFKTDPSSNIVSESIVHNKYIPKGRSSDGLRMIFSSGELSSTVQVIFTLDTSVYDTFMIKIKKLNPSSTSGSLGLQISQDGGINFESGASAYSIAGGYLDNLGAYTANGSAAAARIAMCSLTTSQSNISGEVWLDSIETDYSGATWQLRDSASGAGMKHHYGSGHYVATGGYDAIRVNPTTGNFTTGIIELWGLPK